MEEKEAKYILLKPETAQWDNSSYKMDDEIDLFEIWDIIYKRKFFIIAFTFFISLLAFSYCLFSKKTYEAKAYLFWAKSQDIRSLYEWQKTIGSRSSMNVISLIKELLVSHENEKEFFDKYDINIKKDIIKPKGKDIVTFFLFEEKKKNKISLKAHKSAEFVAQTLNNYLKFIKDKATKQLIDEQKYFILFEIKNLKKNIELNKIEIKELNKFLKNKKRTLNTEDLFNQRFKLSSENILKKNIINILKTVEFNEKRIKPFIIDKKAEVPKKQSSPKTKLIVTVGFVAGLFLSIFVVIFLNFINEARKRRKSL